MAGNETASPLLRHGDAGPAVIELQARLAATGHAAGDDLPGRYGAGTERAVRGFQAGRGLRVDGICGPQTWGALVEAGYRLGDRLLYRRGRMLRGDDVGELQRRLGALGFDAGRVDGIFGDATAAALTEFQRNIGLTVDGVCGPATVAALSRLAGRELRDTTQPAEVVAGVRERDALRHGPRTLAGRRVALGHGGELGALTSGCAQALRALGADVVLVEHPDGSQQADEANRAEAAVYLGLTLAPDSDGVWSAYYRGYRYESPGGKRLAQLLQDHLPPAVGVPDLGTRGMALPVLRETRMPAVVSELGPPARIVEGAAALGAGLARAVGAWAAETWD